MASMSASRPADPAGLAGCWLRCKPGDEQDPRDANGNVIYDKGVTLLDTWRALEGLVDEGRCRAIGLSDVSLEKVKEIFGVARIKPAVVHVESHPYLPEWD